MADFAHLGRAPDHRYGFHRDDWVRNLYGRGTGCGGQSKHRQLTQLLFRLNGVPRNNEQDDHANMKRYDDHKNCSVSPSGFGDGATAGGRLQYFHLVRSLGQNYDLDSLNANTVTG